MKVVKQCCCLQRIKLNDRRLSVCLFVRPSVRPSVPYIYYDPKSRTEMAYETEI